MDNKNIFSKNLKKYMDSQGKSRTDISKALGISYYTVSDWVKGKKYPRMDKVELLANYFDILKSDLIEDACQNKNTPEECSSGENPPRITKVSEGERMLLELFRKVPEDRQQLVLQMIRAAVENQG